MQVMAVSDETRYDASNWGAGRIFSRGGEARKTETSRRLRNELKVDAKTRAKWPKNRCETEGKMTKIDEKPMTNDCYLEEVEHG